MKTLSRERIREIVLAEKDIFNKGASLKNENTDALLEKLGTLEFLTREDVYNSSPGEVEKLINTNFKEIVSVNSVVSMMALTFANSIQNDPVDVNNLSSEDAEGYQFFKDFTDFSAKYPEAVGLDGKSTNALQALQTAMSSGNMSDAGDILPELLMHMDGGVHSCVRVRVENVLPSAGVIVFDFINDDAQSEFCEFLKIPKKNESMIELRGCEFDEDDYPEKGKLYDLNIVEMMELDWDEVTDSPVIGISMDGSDLWSTPFYDDDDDDDKEFEKNSELFILNLEGVPAMVASISGNFPKEYLNSDGTLNQPILEEINSSLQLLAILNREDEVEFNEPFIQSKQKSLNKLSLTVEDYKRTFIDVARLGFVGFDSDPEDDLGKFTWVVRPKRFANIDSLSNHILKIDGYGEEINSFFLSEEGEIIPN